LVWAGRMAWLMRTSPAAGSSMARWREQSPEPSAPGHVQSPADPARPAPRSKGRALEGESSRPHGVTPGLTRRAKEGALCLRSQETAGLPW
jgi:hypothetical protein